MSPPAELGEEALTVSDAKRAAQAAGAPPAEDGASGHWSQIPQASLHRLITEQIPRFRSRPYIADAQCLRESLARGLATSLCGDFCWSLSFSAGFVAALCYEGLLPICCELGGGTGLYVLLPKLHAERCVLSFDRLHVSRKVRRRAKRYWLTVGAAFDLVLRGCIEQHGESWLYPPLQSALRALAAAQPASPIAPAQATPAGAPSAAAPAPACGTRACARPAAPVLAALLGGGGAELSRACGCSGSTPARAAEGGGAARDADGAAVPDVRVCSFELWREGRLVGGEVGCVVGCAYTSFSGFHVEDGAGSVQQAMTARLLERAGFRFWDLGQQHDYKLGMGAEMVPRAAFLAALHDARDQHSRLETLVRDCGGRITPGDVKLMQE